MRISWTQTLNAIAIMGVTGLLVVAGSQSNANSDNRGLDMMTTASVPVVRPVAGNLFMATNHTTNKSCILALHRAEGYDVHRLEPADNCRQLGDELAEARAWHENTLGNVTVTDYRGNELLQLARSDGFSWDVLKPSRLEISLNAF